MTLTRTILFSGCLAASLFSQTPARVPKTARLISPALVDAVVLIAPPPAMNSTKLSTDLADIYALHRSATPQGIAARHCHSVG